MQIRLVGAAAFCCVTALAAQAPQTPVFRSGVELLDVDVSVVDGDGNPIRDLQPSEFAVTVDGQTRRVSSSEFISDVNPAPQPADNPFVSNNTDRRPGRLVAVVIDQNNITMERLRSAIEPTRRFIAGFAPNDRVALLTIPSPGPRVEFTTNHGQILEALGRAVGHVESDRGRYNVSAYEALMLESKADSMAIDRMMIRLCGDVTPSAVSSCAIDVEEEAGQIVQELRTRTAESVSALAALLKNLKDVEGPKQLILLSQGLMLEGSRSEAGMLAQLAAEANVNVNVMLFDTHATNASARANSATEAQDRDLREAGLDAVAARSRGALFRVATNPQYIFDRLARELGGHYMLGVDPAPADRDGRRHTIKVQVTRRGTMVRARQEFQYVNRAPNTWSRDDLMGRVLRSPSASTQLPMRLTTYTYRNGDDPKMVKLIVAAELEPTTTGAVDVAIGHVLYDMRGQPLDIGQERKVYSANSDRPLRYELAMLAEPGKYRLRVGAIDLAGSSGSVERDVEVGQILNQEFALGDLMLASVRDAKNGTVRPPVLVKVDDGQIVTFTEVYTNKPGSLARSQVVFEVADDTDAPALQSNKMDFKPRDDGLSAEASTAMTLGALPPGHYVMRAVVTSPAGTVAGKLVRPFDVLPGSAASKVASVKPANYKRDDVLMASTLASAFDVMEQAHPAAKAAFAKARTGQYAGTSLQAMEAGDQGASSLLRGLENLSKGQLDPAATQFTVAMRNPGDAAIASFFLGACYAEAGRDRDAITNWQRALGARLAIPALPMLIAQAHLRLGEPAEAVAPLADALARNPADDGLRKSLAMAQLQTGKHEDAYATITPYLQTHAGDADALLVALQAIYQVHAEGKSIRADDKTAAAKYAQAYSAAGGASQALVEKWLKFIAEP